jgi:hypothetical protein
MDLATGIKAALRPRQIAESPRRIEPFCSLSNGQDRRSRDSPFMVTPKGHPMSLPKNILLSPDAAKVRGPTCC